MSRKLFCSQPLQASLLILALLALAGTAGAQNRMHIDATAPVPSPEPVAAALGTSRAPDGQTITVNSQYLVRNGKPWVPVMGEMHFSRVPATEWEDEILKMQAAGVNIIATYVIWIHHEEVEGQFDWTGDHDLRSFLELCRKHHMEVFLRVGPWAHGEARNGGLPDWVLAHGPTRRNDPVYLREVGAYFEQIGQQTHGMTWKDGGPIVGVQLENEYRGGGGPGEGTPHILKLKEMVRAVGLDVPLYTVTGWDGAAVPLTEVLPVYGGYPDAPWDSSPKKLPPNEVYAFRWSNRAAGNMGALGAGGQNGAAAYRGTPFMTAEVGAGMEDTYFRRPVIAPDDIAAMIPVMLGSGANLLGYYMFHGGRNPQGKLTTLQESQRTNYPTDVPVRSYDFQAPLGEYGDQREVLLRLKLIHSFLRDFGPSLATMTPRAPDRTPADREDLSVPRVGARTNGEAGYVFFNNYVRGTAMPARPGFQVELALPRGESVRVPESPIDLPSGAYGIWPVNLPLGDGAPVLRYSTAQLCARLEWGGQPYYFFFVQPGVSPEFALVGAVKPANTTAGVQVTRANGLTLLRPPASTTSHVMLAGLHGAVHLVLMPQAEAERMWTTRNADGMLVADANVFSDGTTTTLRSLKGPNFTFALLGKGPIPTATQAVVRETGYDGLLTHYAASVVPASLHVAAEPLKPAARRGPFQPGPPVAWRKETTVMAPEDAEFTGAATWRVRLEGHASPAVHQLFLRFEYQGDVARLYRGDTLLDDNFWNGDPFVVGLGAFGINPQAAAGGADSLTLKVLPLPAEAPMYLEKRDLLHLSPGTQAASLEGVQSLPEYQLTLELGGKRTLAAAPFARMRRAAIHCPCDSGEFLLQSPYAGGRCNGPFAVPSTEGRVAAHSLAGLNGMLGQGKQQ